MKLKRYEIGDIVMAVSYNKLWRTRVRAVGIEVSINLQGGKKVRLERDTSLKDTDIKTGIAD